MEEATINRPTTEAEEGAQKPSSTTKNVEEEVEELKSRITDLENYDNVISSDETVKDLPAR